MTVVRRSDPDLHLDATDQSFGLLDAWVMSPAEHFGLMEKTVGYPALRKIKDKPLKALVVGQRVQDL